MKELQAVLTGMATPQSIVQAFGSGLLVPMIAGPEGGPSSDMQRYEG